MESILQFLTWESTWLFLMVFGNAYLFIIGVAYLDKKCSVREVRITRRKNINSNHYSLWPSLVVFKSFLAFWGITTLVLYSFLSYAPQRIPQTILDFPRMMLTPIWTVLILCGTFLFMSFIITVDSYVSKRASEKMWGGVSGS